MGNTRYDHRVEKAYYDTDLKATQAVRELYSHGVMVSKIQKAFSVGAFGVEKKRRLVPTRWSITAVDDIISRGLVEQVKTFPEINEYRVYESVYLDNVFEIVMIPAQWSYESMEAWYPGTTWNPNGTQVIIYSDPKVTIDAAPTPKSAAATTAPLSRLRTTPQRTPPSHRHRAPRSPPGYIMPIGVWQVEKTSATPCAKPPTLQHAYQALKFVSGRFEIPMEQWIVQGKLLRHALFQKRISDFFAPTP